MTANKQFFGNSWNQSDEFNVMFGKQSNHTHSFTSSPESTAVSYIDSTRQTQLVMPLNKTRFLQRILNGDNPPRAGMDIIKETLASIRDRIVYFSNQSNVTSHFICVQIPTVYDMFRIVKDVTKSKIIMINLYDGLIDLFNELLGEKRLCFRHNLFSGDFVCLS